MNKNKLILTSFLHSLGMLAYIMLVAWIMSNAKMIFGEMNDFWGPVIFLMLFVFSAFLSGLLVLGRPIWLYLEHKKKEALFFLFVVFGWMFVLLIIVFAIKLL